MTSKALANAERVADEAIDALSRLANKMNDIMDDVAGKCHTDLADEHLSELADELRRIAALNSATADRLRSELESDA